MIIIKKELVPLDFQTVELPVACKILTVEVVDDKLLLFVLGHIETQQSYEIIIVQNEMYNLHDVKYIKTVQYQDKILHIFHKWYG